MRFGSAYYDAKALQTSLLQAIHDEKTSARDRAQCTRSWIELERLKREIRGIPPLAPAKWNEIAARLKRARPAELAEPVEV
jgi:hypothetical protein